MSKDMYRERIDSLKKEREAEIKYYSTVRDSWHKNDYEEGLPTHIHTMNCCGKRISEINKKIDTIVYFKHWKSIDKIRNKFSKGATP